MTRGPARRNDPATSKKGAETAKAMHQTIALIICEGLEDDEHGMINDEIWEYVAARITVQGRDSVTPRMVKMERDKLVCRHLLGYNEKGDSVYEERRSKRTNHSQEIWWSYAVGLRLGFVEGRPLPPVASHKKIGMFW